MDALRLSYSFIQEFQTCPKKTLYNRIKGIRPKKEPSYYILGNMVHAGIEAWMMDLNVQKAIDNVCEKVDIRPMNQKERTDFQIDRSIAIGILDAYRIRYSTDKTRFGKLQTEKRIDFTISKDPYIYYRSVIDMLVQDEDGKWWVYDHKTAGQINDNYLQQASISNQTLGYLYAARKFLGEWPKGIVYNIILKPSIRPRKKRNPETLDQFCSRLYQEYTTNPDKYFYREDILTNRKAVKVWLQETMLHAGIIFDNIQNTALGDLVWTKNTGACFNYSKSCQYLPICTSGKVNKMLYTVEKQTTLSV